MQFIFRTYKIEDKLINDKCYVYCNQPQADIFIIGIPIDDFWNRYSIGLNIPEYLFGKDIRNMITANNLKDAQNICSALNYAMEMGREQKAAEIRDVLGIKENSGDS